MARKKRAQPPIDPRKARAECFLLCDFARSENGKLDILGGGWDHIVPRQLPLDYDAYLAIKVQLPWAQIADAAILRVDLMDTDGQILGDPVVDATLRLDAIRAGKDEEPPYGATILMTTGVKMTLTKPGRYILQLIVNDDVVVANSFVVTSSPVGESPLELEVDTRNTPPN
jgi:hypothetical protein